ncbi:hypothetical protein ACFX2J_025261 [Malus domestica]
MRFWAIQRKSKPSQLGFFLCEQLRPFGVFCSRIGVCNGGNLRFRGGVLLWNRNGFENEPFQCSAAERLFRGL